MRRGTVGVALVSLLLVLLRLLYPGSTMRLQFLTSLGKK